GGLALDAMGLEQNDADEERLEDIYGRLGLLRRWQVYSLVYKEEQYAVMIVNQSDMGINLSELLNCIKVIVTKPEDLSKDVLSIAVSNLVGGYKTDRVPVMFYPFSYVVDNNIPYEKTYQLWVINVDYANEFMEYMSKRFRINYK
ncbi:MAG TPA: hypothetical protein VJ373_07530, partial [Desulfatiglandales bacterium]|nr:hypothetical protein [Desulfatiglandales bacterium]